MDKIETLRRPGIKTGSTAWNAAMLTPIPPTHMSLIILISLENILHQFISCVFSFVWSLSPMNVYELLTDILNGL